MMWIIGVSLMMVVMAYWIAGNEKARWRGCLRDSRGLMVCVALLGFTTGVVVGRLTSRAVHGDVKVDRQIAAEVGTGGKEVSVEQMKSGGGVPGGVAR